MRGESRAERPVAAAARSIDSDPASAGRAAGRAARLLPAWRPRDWLVWVALFALFLGVRLYHLERAPEHNVCADEYAWTWAGMTLLESGTPQSWSGLGGYRRRATQTIHWRGNRYRLVEPWLDHPPLYALYAGGWMRALGHRDILEVDLRQMRSSSVALAAVSFGLLTLLLRRLLPPPPALLALLFYAVLPTVVLHHRLVVSENLGVPFVLAAALLILQQRERWRWWRAGAIALPCALLPMTKVALLSACVFIAMLALICDRSRRRWFSAAGVVFGTVAGFGAYVLYGRELGGELFDRVLASHRDRFHGFAGMSILLFEPKLTRFEIKELLGMLASALALASLALPDAARAPWGLATLTYAATMAFFVDDHEVYGWYFIPLYPWLCSALAVTIAHASKRRALGLSLLWWTCAWLTIASVAYQHRLLEPERVRYGYLAVLLGLFGAWAAWPKLAARAIPAINALMVAGAVIACLADIYFR